MSDNRKYYYLKLKENYFDDDSIVLLESMQDGVLYSNILLKLYMTGNDHAPEAADPLELAEIKRRWEPYINQLPDYAYLCKDLLNGKM